MKKLISTVLIGILMTTTAHAAIYEDTTTTIITKGVTHQVMDTFTQSGWQKADVIRIDLTNEDLELKVMTSPDGVSTLATVKTMAEEYDTKAAVNADFFNFSSGETNMLGMVYQDGELISTPSTDNFASFVITDENKVLFDYFKFSGKIIAKDITYAEYAEHDIYQINKVPNAFGGITMITSAWGEEVSIPDYFYAIVCEPYKSGKYKMTGYSWGSEKVSIPQGGAVFTSYYTENAFLNLFTMGDIIQVETTISPDIDSIRDASGGNTILVKDGEVAQFTSNISGNAQRTAMGLSSDGKTLYLVTIDGRQEECAGFTQSDLAQFMIKLGCEDAINLDGGGSTTLVTPDRYTGEQTVINEVSSPRKVSTAVGVISHADIGDVKSGEMKLSKDTIIIGDSADISVVFYDENYNNIPFDFSDVHITCTDKYAIIDNNKIMPTTGGTHTVYAEYNNVVLETEITVLDDIFAINIYPEIVNTILSDRQFIVTAYDKSGNSAIIPQSLVTFETTGNVTMNGATVKRGNGKGTVTALYEDLTSVAVINGEKHERESDIKLDDSFEGTIKNGKKITITGPIETPVNLIGMLESKARLKYLSSCGDVYALSDKIYDPWDIFTVYRKVNGFTQRVVENTKIVTLTNNKSSSIRLSEKNAWDNLKIIFDSIEEENLILITNQPIYNMNEGEQRVWNHYMSELVEKGVNVFVVSMGEKSEATVQSGVRYLYVGTLGNYSTESYEYSEMSSSPLTFSFSGDEIRYTFKLNNEG